MGVFPMRGLGFLFALDALDLAHRAARDAERHRTSRARSDGEPSDEPNEADSEARLAAWRAWARRRDVGWGSPALDALPLRRSESGGSAG
jgi:hypothetical protein